MNEFGLTDEDFIKHFGVKGQKWGVRTKSSSGSSVSTATAAPKPPVQSSDRKQAAALYKKPVETLSNKQLKKLNERLQLESSYSKLTKDPNAKTAEDHIKKALAYGTMGTTAYALIKSPAAKALVTVGKTAVTGIVSTGYVMAKRMK